MSNEKLLINDIKSNNSEDMSNKQIEEIYEVLTRECDTSCVECKFDRLDLCVPHHKAVALYNAGYRKQSEGEWKPFDFLHDEENEKDDWKRYACSLCGFITEAYYRDVRDSGYKFCPNCGAKMKGGE